MDAEFGWSLRTAARFMRIYSRFQSVSLFNLNMFLPTALYELSSNSITQDILSETLKLAESGTTITTEYCQNSQKTPY